ncbi:MAG: hypothetical protein OHK0024_28070 [Thalassobaculales bacterium]
MSFIGAGLLAVWADVPPEIEADFNRWYDREHLAERVDTPGFRRARRFVSAGGTGQRYLALYETETVDVLKSAEYLKRLKSLTPWSRRVMPAMQRTHRLCCAAVGSVGAGVGAAVATLRFAAAPGRQSALRRFLADRVLAGLHDRDGVAAAQIWEADVAVTAAGGPQPGAAELLLLIEANDAATAESCWKGVLTKETLADLDQAPPVAGCYRLLRLLAR